MQNVKIESNLRDFLIQEGALERFEDHARYNSEEECTSIASAFVWPNEEVHYWVELERKFKQKSKQ